MKKRSVSAALPLVMTSLVAAILACTFEQAISNFATPTPDYLMMTYQAELRKQQPTLEMMPPWMIEGYLKSAKEAMKAMWEGNPNEMSNLYTSIGAASTPFSDLFGDLDQSETMKSLQNAIPDLQLNWRMTLQQDDWAALAFDLSGHFTQPLVVPSGTIPPTNQPWFTAVHSLIHFNLEGKIDQEYSSADMAVMMHEAGVDGFQNIQVRDVIMDAPMAEITPSADPAAVTNAEKLAAAVGNGPFFFWLPGSVPTVFSTTVTYHSPYGDAVNDVSEIEQQLLYLGDSHVLVPQMVRQGNAIAMAYTYNGIVEYPVEFSDGTVIPASNQEVQFSGVVFGNVDAAGNAEAWVLFNRLDNPITMENFESLLGAAAPEALPESEATLTPTPSALSMTPTPLADTTAATCTLTAPQQVNLRSGPGTSFEVGGTLAASQAVEADGQTQSSDGRTWFHIAVLNLWVRSDVVTSDCGTLPDMASTG